MSRVDQVVVSETKTLVEVENQVRRTGVDKVVRHAVNVGPRGPAGTDGEKGDTGATGAGLNVLGSLEDYADLPTTGLNPGDGYIIDGVVWVWDGSAWVEVEWSGPELPRRLHEEAQVAGSDWVGETGWTTEGTPVESTFTRASQAWDGSGLVAPNTMRVFGRDTKSPVVLIEGQRTNLFLNSGTPTEQTFTGTGAHTISMHGTGSLQLSGDSTATVTEGNPVTVTLSGTLTVTPVGNVQWAQVEEAPFASSYIPTDGAPATRASEVFTVSEVPIPAGSPFTVSIASPVNAKGTTEALVGFSLSASSWSNNHLALRRILGGIEINSRGIAGGNVRSAATNSELVTYGQSMVPITLVYDGSNLQFYVAGKFTQSHEIGQTPELGVAGIGLWAPPAPHYYPCFRPIAPGAAALGIPFIDNRAWSAEEIQAAHARWLPELEKIEVPV